MKMYGLKPKTIQSKAAKPNDKNRKTDIQTDIQKKKFKQTIEIVIKPQLTGSIYFLSVQ